MAKNLRQLKKDVGDLEKRLNKAYDVELTTRATGRRSVEFTKQNIIEKNVALGRNPFRLFGGDKSTAYKLYYKGLRKILFKGERPQTALVETGQFIRDAVKRNIDSNLSSESPKEYHKDYKRFKLKKKGTLIPFYELDGHFLKSLTYYIKRRK